MSKIPGNGRLIIKYLITILAIANLVLLFFFDYKVPGCSYLIHKVEANRTRSADKLLEKVKEKQASEEKEAVTIAFENKTLKYNGKDKLDLMKDVTVTDSKGNNLGTKFLVAMLEDTGKENKKKITYNFSDDGGRTASVERTLELKDYAGAPTITADENELPRLRDTSDDFLKKNYLQYVVADDGFGNDVSRSAEISLIRDSENDEVYTLKFSITNQVGDSASIEFTKRLYHNDEEDDEQ